MYDKRGLAVNQKCLLERLLVRVDRFDFENQMGCSELPVPMNKNLGPEYKVQVPDVDHPDIWDKHFAIYKK